MNIFSNLYARFAAGLIVMAYAGGLAAIAQPGAPAAPNPSKPKAQEDAPVTERIAVVRIKDVIDKYRRFKILDRKLKRNFKRKLQNIENRKKTLAEERAGYMDVNTGYMNVKTKEELDRLLEIERQIYDLKQEYEAFYKTVNAIELKMARQLFADIRLEIEAQAKKHHIAHVMSVLTLAQVEKEASSLEELVMTYRSAPVLYFDPDLDITDEVLADLNGKYDESKDPYYTTKDLTKLLTPEDIKAQEDAIKRQNGEMDDSTADAGDDTGSATGGTGGDNPSPAPAPKSDDTSKPKDEGLD